MLSIQSESLVEDGEFMVHFENVTRKSVGPDVYIYIYTMQRMGGVANL